MSQPEHDTDAEFDRALAQALGPEAGETAGLSRAVLSRLAAAPRTPGSPRLAEVLAGVLAAPLPAAAALLSTLLLAGAAGYALLPATSEETLLFLLLGF